MAVVAFINRDPAEIGPRLKQSDVMWQSAGDGLVGRPTEDHVCCCLSCQHTRLRVCVCMCVDLLALEDLIIDYDCIFLAPSRQI